MTATAASPVRCTPIDGVPVFWAAAPGPLHAELVFGVGRADESFRTSGVTHLVEHLVMRRLGELSHTANAAVSLFLTGFEVTGSPAVVVDHLRRVCESIRTLDVSEVDRERSVLVAEEDDRPTSPVAALPLAVRYGNRGPGLVFCRQLGAHLVPPDAVRAWAAERLHRSNAALVLTGPPPPGLTLPLPDGPRPRRVLPPTLRARTPGWTHLPIDGVLAVLHGRWTAETSVGLSILEERLTRRLRHEAGLVYGVDVALEHLPGGAAAVGIGLGLSGRPAHVPVLRDTFLAVLDELCAAGPSTAELERDRERCRADIADEGELARERAYDEAAVLLAGTARFSDRVGRRLAGVRPDDVRAALAELRSSLTLGVPEGAEPESLPRSHAPHLWPATGRTFRRSRLGSFVPRGAVLTVGRSALTYREPGACPETIRYADVVGVGSEPGPAGNDDHVYVVHGAEGEVVVVRAWDWRGGIAALDLLHEAIPREAFFLTPPEMRLVVDD